MNQYMSILAPREASALATDERSETPEITFHFIKSNFFRVFHVDGAWGGITPSGLIEINFYSERFPIPRQIFHPILPGGRLGNEFQERRVSKEGLVREIEAGAMMDLNTAKSVRDWLNDQIKVLEERQQAKQG